MHIGEKKTAETCVYYAEKHPGQKQFGRRTLLNIGVAKAKAAARQTAAKVICPKFAEPKNGGTDFNDLATEEGIEVVRNQLDSTKAAFIEFDKGSKKSSPENKSKNVSDLEKRKGKDQKNSKRARGTICSRLSGGCLLGSAGKITCQDRSIEVLLRLQAGYRIFEQFIWKLEKGS